MDGNHVLSATAQSTPDSAVGSNPALYLGLGIGVGGALLVAIAIIVIQIVRKSAQHKRELSSLEQGQEVTLSQTHQRAHGDPTTSRHRSRRVSLLPIHTQAGWDALSSMEDINDHNARSRKKLKLASVVLPRRIKRHEIPLSSLRHLSAVVESPLSRVGRTPQDAQLQWEKSVVDAAQKRSSESATRTILPSIHEDLIFRYPQSPKAKVMPSFAIKPTRLHAMPKGGNGVKPPRSISVGALPDQAWSDALFQNSSGLDRPHLHARSISLGVQPPSQPPSNPVPPLPIIAPLSSYVRERSQGLSLSRTSSSSSESASSSVLVSSPTFRSRREKRSAICSRLELLVANDSKAELKSLSSVSRRSPFECSDSYTAAHPISVAASMASFHECEGSSGRRRPSSSSITSFNVNGKRLSSSQSPLADGASMSRESSLLSLQSALDSRKLATPRKGSRSRVSASGSPAERPRKGVLQDISSNTMTPTRQPSNETQRSTNSSNGNPFQWDSAPLQKPSALKGSPNARKGHKRQNCVRISTLTPQVLGPPPSRPTSPGIMHGIEEESGDENESIHVVGQPNNPNRRLHRFSAANVFAPSLRIQTLRASLTPSSPTLSVWAAYQDHGLPSHSSDSCLSTSSTGEQSRPVSRNSYLSAGNSVPIFPSLGKATVEGARRNVPVPIFCLSNPDDEGDSSPFEIRVPSEGDLPVTASLPNSANQEYDPAWSALRIHSTDGMKEYDPASPAITSTDLERSSPFVASTVTLSDDTFGDEHSPCPTATAAHSPSCSPKSMPEGFGPFFDSNSTRERIPRAAQKLTSENASSLMAHLPIVGFPGAPVLPPPHEENPVPLPQRTQRHRSSSDMTGAASRPLHKLNIEYTTQESQAKHSPQGPRTEPGKSILKHAMALRRMNSEVDPTRNRASRRYLHLGREGSPLLPFTESPNPNESCNNLFDFGFVNMRDHDTEAGAVQTASPLATVDLDMWDQKLIHAFRTYNVEETTKKPGSVHSRLEPPGEDESHRDWQNDKAASKLAIPEPRSMGTAACDVKCDTPKQSTGILGASEDVPTTETPLSLYDADGFLKA